MLDFPMIEHSMGTAFFCIAVYLLVFCLNYTRAIKYPYICSVNKSTKQMQIFLIGLIIVIFCKKGDFFHLMETVHGYNFTPGAYNYGEEVYLQLGKLLDRNYLLFRIVVWGGAFALYCWTAKRLKIPVYYAAMLLFCSYIVLFSYARATAAMAVYFFGISFLCKPIKNRKLISYIIGAIIIYTSWTFHNSAIVMIVITIILLMPLRKWSIALILIGIPFIATIAKEYFYAIMIIAEDSESAVGGRMAQYSQSERGSAISQTILRTFKYSSFYIPIIISTITIFTKNNIKKIPVHIIRLYKVAFGIIFMASIIYLFGASFYVMFYRVLYMAMIPVCLITTALYKEGYISKKQFKWCYTPGIIFCILDCIYDVYAIYTTI